MPRTARSWPLVMALGASLAARPSLAIEGDAPRRAVTVKAPGCASLLASMEPLMRSLELELAPSALEPRAESSAPAARVTLHVPQCEFGSTLVRFEVQTDAAPFGLRRSVPLENVPTAARARTLAITIAESIREALQSSRPGANTAAPGAVNDENGPGARSERVSTAPESAETTHLGAAAHGRFAFEASAPFLGVELNLRTPVSEHVALSFEGSYAVSNDRKKIEGFDFDFDMDLWTLALGPDFVAGDRPRLSVGPRLGLGRFDVAQRGLFFTDDALSSITVGFDGLVAFAGLRGSASLPLGDVVTLDASLDVHHMWGSMPELPSYGSGAVGVVLPGYAYETPPPPPDPQRLGLYPWMVTLGVGVGFRL